MPVKKKAKSKVNAAGNYTKPTMRKNLFKKIKASTKGGKAGRRYLPDAAWKALSPAEKKATNTAKAKGNKKGKQFVSQPKKIAKKTARYRK